ncbi:GNAT family N-acetyltransferase [Niveispirillum sp. KHB5.9]|uniref:GNAT family N-acetyltransferase n=1 Tax=Niveispirillum sp. KHB5.9 TaxID=3400269 RepID=UPI003A888C6B
MLSYDRIQDIALLEDLSMTAWPAPRRIIHGGWALYFAAGHTGRANSANAVVPLATIDDATITLFETEYRRQGLAPMFRLTPLTPPDLGARLAVRGYGIASESKVFWRSLKDMGGAAPDAAVRVQDRLDKAWMDAYRRMVPVPEVEMPALMSILTGIAVRTRFATLWQDGEPVAACLAVLDRDWVGFFKVACRADRRGQGLPRRLMQDMMGRAAAEGAVGAYLQVGAGNAPALALYARLGFQHLYDYAYAKLG